MKKNILYLIAGCMMLLVSCKDPEYVNPTAERQGITSLKAIFTSGPYEDKEAVVYNITDMNADRYVIPVPWFYPEDSENETTDYMSAMRVQAELAPNCKIEPALTILDLNKDNYFTYTNAYGESKRICITGERTKSDKCQLLGFSIPDYGITGIVDEATKTISLPSAENLSACHATYMLSPHATISPDPSVEVVNLDDPFEFTVTAHNGTSSQVYTVEKTIPNKIPYGYRTGSETELFKLDMGVIGLPWTSSNQPSLAGVGNYLVVCLGDGTTVPTYYDASIGTKVGTINLGSIGLNTLGGITSDSKGNMLLMTKAAAGQTLTIYKTSSVTDAPQTLLTFPNNTGLDMGSRISVQGDINGDASIMVTCDGVAESGSNTFVRWIVTGGTVGSPETVHVNGVGYWAVPVSNTKVVSKGTTAQSDYFLSYYSDNTLYWVSGSDNNALHSLTDEGTGNSNYNCLAAREFNNAYYMALFCPPHFPQWGVTSLLFMYDVTTDSSFSGTISTSGALVFKPTLTSFNGAEGPAATGDILLAPTTDGYKMRIFYIDNNCKIVGAYEVDCIEK